MRTKLFSLIMILSVFVFHATAQVFNVPKKAKEHFKQNYPAATDVDWKNNVADYDCHFKLDSIECIANYNMDGKWDYTEKHIARESIPSEVSTSFSNSKYRDREVESAVYVENHKNEKLYRYELKDGIRKVYVFFDPTGKFMSESPTL